MARIARVVIPGLPHHITQRGVRRMPVFFSDDDRRDYLDVLSEQGKRFGVHYIAWCLMDNHIHLIAVPESESSLAKGIGEAHKRYSRMINFREGWRGYLFQGRFFSCPLQGTYAVAAIRYVLRNPVRACICQKPWEYMWSSAQWMVGLRDIDPLACDSPLLEEVDDWNTLLGTESCETEVVRQHTRTGRPLCTDSFLEHLETITGRTLRLRKAGRKPKNKDEALVHTK